MITKLRTHATCQDYHYKPVHKIGYTGVRCWCGAELWFHYSEKARARKSKDFQAMHDLCSPKVVDEGGKDARIN